MSENGREVIGYREPKCELKCELELAKWSVDGAHIRKTELKCELDLAFELAFELAFWLLRISLMTVFRGRNPILYRSDGANISDLPSGRNAGFMTQSATAMRIPA